MHTSWFGGPGLEVGVDVEPVSHDGISDAVHAVSVSAGVPVQHSARCGPGDLRPSGREIDGLVDGVAVEGDHCDLHLTEQLSRLVVQGSRWCLHDFVGAFGPRGWTPPAPSPGASPTGR